MKSLALLVLLASVTVASAASPDETHSRYPIPIPGQCIDALNFLGEHMDNARLDYEEGKFFIWFIGGGATGLA
jgi:hypothetical protein